MAPTQSFEDAAVAIFCRNEMAHIDRCLTHVAAAVPNRDIPIHVFVNGSNDDTLGLLRRRRDHDLPALRLYRIPFADKSNAWNQYIYAVRSEAAIHFFVDAYVFVTPGAFHALHEALAANPVASAATGLPTCGRTAAQLAEHLRRGGGIHGSLHALRGSFVDRLRARELRLPIGLYRGDGLITSFAMFNLDPLHFPWTVERVAAVDGATWSLDTLSPWRKQDLERYLQRRMRQAKGRIESRSIRDIVRQRGFEALPATAAELIEAYLERKENLADFGILDRLIIGFQQRQWVQSPNPGDKSLLAEQV